MPTRSPDPDDCTALLAHGSRSFRAASLLLPVRVRAPATALYAFCRIADDAVDGEVIDGAPSAERARLGLTRMRCRLDRIYRRRPVQAAADRAFARVVAEHRIPRALPDALLEGFEWDVERRRYRDLAALEAYAARVAGSVGAMMALLMGAKDPDVIARACDLGVAMQLSNIARDVGEDARAGRLYLPLDWLDDEGIDATGWLRAPVHDAALARVVARLLARARSLYANASGGIRRLPPDCRPGIRAARALYAEIGNEVARNGHDSVGRRAVVGGTRKLAVLLGALSPWQARAFGGRGEGCTETGFLVEAVRSAPVPAAGHPPGAAGHAHAKPRLVAFLDMVERLERLDRLRLESSRGALASAHRHPGAGG
ncbi:MAG: phytoene/squalene synthase family protein [Lautropia sp.]